MMNPASFSSSPLHSSIHCKDRPVGYSDTPVLPNSRVEGARYRPASPDTVTPGKTNADAPADAIVLFDGTDLSAFFGETETPNPDPKKDRPIRTPNPEEPAKWKIVDDYFEMTPTGNIRTKEQFGDCQLHIEWRSPSPVEDNSQNRGNSGIFFLDKYEIQVLDAYENPTYADGHPGSVYGQSTTARKRRSQAGRMADLRHPLHSPPLRRGWFPHLPCLRHRDPQRHRHPEPHRDSKAPTRHKALAKLRHPARSQGHLRIQDHNDNQKVAFRNIWIRNLE